jgi:crotonobetaine/carnitine-CoA ligase
VVVIAERFLAAFAEVADELPDVELVIVPDTGRPLPRIGKTTLTGEQFLGGVDPAPDLEGPGPWDQACILLTSGTTGPSKGVMVPWGELYYSFIDVPMPELVPHDGWYSMWPPYHVTGKLHFYMPVHFNVLHVLRDVFSPAAFWDDVRTHDVRYTALVSPMAQMLLAQPDRPDDADNPLEYVSIVPMIEQHAEFARRFGVLLATGFGMSEIGVITVTDEYTVEDWRSCGRTRLGSAGYEIRVVDEHDRPVAPGEVGELIVRTAEPWALNLGYYGMPDKTIEAWRNGWFHTGDVFKVDADGNFYYIDRYKDAIRRRGENISSFEVEAYVNSHPEVVESAAIAVPSELGEDEVKVCVVCTADSALTPEQLIEFLIPTMPRFMVPRFVEFADALPKTEATLRVQKSKLRDDPINEATWDREAAGIELPR